MREQGGKVRDRLGDNPFYVLELGPGCGRAEMERAGQRLLAMLEVGLSKAASYRTPVGERERTADKVRQAMAELRDPEKRLTHELWARLPAERDPVVESAVGASSGDPGHAGEEGRLLPFPEAPVVLGWRRA